MTVITHPLINSLRCLKTDNICGTDTWEINNPCMCEPCQEYLQRKRVIEEAYTWIGTGFHHQGNVKGVGVDCAQFLLQVYYAAGILESLPKLEHYSADWHIHKDEERYLKTMLQFPTIEILNKPQFGDIAIFKFARTFSHSAIVIDWPTCIHAYVGRRVEVIDITKDSQFINRSIRFFTCKNWRGSFSI